MIMIVTPDEAKHLFSRMSNSIHAGLAAGLPRSVGDVCAHRAILYLGRMVRARLLRHANRQDMNRRANHS